MSTRPLTSASNLHRREACPGSAFAEDGMPELESAVSAEGTHLHALLADPSIDRSHLSHEQSTCLHSAEMSTSSILKAVELMASKLNASFKASQFSEGRETELFLRRGIRIALTGHADYWRYYPSSRLLVMIDYKFGRVAVDDSDINLQLRAYAVMGAEKLDCDRVVVAIVQPRVAGQPAPADYTREALQQAKQHIFQILDSAHKKDGSPRDDAPRQASESACRYCRASLQCPTYQETYSFLADAAPMGKEAFVQDRIMRMSDAELDKIYTACKFAALVQDSAKDEILRRLKLGGMPGWQCVPGKKSSEITDRARAVRLIQGIGLSIESVLDCAKISLPDLAEELRRRENMSQKAAKEKIYLTLQPVLETKESSPSIKRLDKGQMELLP